MGYHLQCHAGELTVITMTSSPYFINQVLNKTLSKTLSKNFSYWVYCVFNPLIYFHRQLQFKRTNFGKNIMHSSILHKNHNKEYMPQNGDEI